MAGETEKQNEARKWNSSLPTDGGIREREGNDELEACRNYLVGLFGSEPMRYIPAFEEPARQPSKRKNLVAKWG